MNIFEPNTTADADKVNQNFAGLADGTELDDDVILARHISDQEDWTDLTLLNSWVNYGGEYEPAQYFKTHTGLVIVRGLIKSGTTTSGTTLATLPEGYRPLYRRISVQNSNNLFARVDVNDDGSITTSGTVSSNWLTLNIIFRAEQ